MPAKTPKQAKAAQLEYLRRTVHGVRKQRRGAKNRRAFGTASKEVLKEFFSV